MVESGLSWATSQRISLTTPLCLPLRPCGTPDCIIVLYCIVDFLAMAVSSYGGAFAKNKREFRRVPGLYV